MPSYLLDTNHLGLAVRKGSLVAKRIEIYRMDGSTARQKKSDQLSGEDAVPGFSCKACDILADVLPRDDGGPM